MLALTLALVHYILITLVFYMCCQLIETNEMM